MDVGALLVERAHQGRGDIGHAAGLGGHALGQVAHAVGQIGDLRGDDEDARAGGAGVRGEVGGGRGAVDVGVLVLAPRAAAGGRGGHVGAGLSAV